MSQHRQVHLARLLTRVYRAQHDASISTQALFMSSLNGAMDGTVQQGGAKPMLAMQNRHPHGAVGAWSSVSHGGGHAGLMSAWGLQPRPFAAGPGMLGDAHKTLMRPFTTGTHIMSSHPTQEQGKQNQPETSASSTADNKSAPAQQQAAAIRHADWTAELFTLPNSLSIARAVSGPFIAQLILEEQWAVALAAVTISGVSERSAIILCAYGILSLPMQACWSDSYGPIKAC